MGDRRQPRIEHLTAQWTSRDLFGVVRGACRSCGSCGKYVKATEDYTIKPGSVEVGPPSSPPPPVWTARLPPAPHRPTHLPPPQGQRHPDNDPLITCCSRCGCLPEEHAVVMHEQVAPVWRFHQARRTRTLARQQVEQQHCLLPTLSSGPPLCRSVSWATTRTRWASGTPRWPTTRERWQTRWAPPTPASTPTAPPRTWLRAGERWERVAGCTALQQAGRQGRARPQGNTHAWLACSAA